MSATIVSCQSTSLKDEHLAFDQSIAKRTKVLDQLCAVCGDRADSKHYGAYSCNGCKGFFRRTVWNSRQYSCKNNGHCVIEKEIRIACKACRFTQCLKAGMNPKELQSTRKPKLGKQNNWPPEQETQQIELCLLEPRATTLILNPFLDRSQVDALVMLDRHIMNRIDPPVILLNRSMTTGTTEVPFLTALHQPSLVSARTEMSLSAHRIADINDVLCDFQRKFVLYADWLNEFHDFRMLPEYLKLILAKTCFSRYSWATSAWRTVQIGCPGMSFVNGSYYPQDQKLMCLPDTRGVTSLSMENVVGPMKSLNVDEIEYILLKIINLFTEDSLDLNDLEKKLVRDKREKYLDILTTYVQSRYSQFSEQEAACRVGEMMLIIASLTDIAYLSNDNVTCWDTLRIAHLGELTCEVNSNQPSSSTSAAIALPTTAQISSLINEN